MSKKVIPNLENEKERNLEKLKKELGDFFKATREELGYKTKDDFSDAKNLTRSQYALYESGKANPTIETIFNLLWEFGLDYQELFNLPHSNNKYGSVIIKEVAPMRKIEQVKEQVYLLKEEGLDKRLSDLMVLRILRTLAFCIKPKSKGEILENLGLKNTTNNFQRSIGLALELEWLVMTDPFTPNSPQQKYFTSEEGRKFI
ncbi:helix-turn-helix transcriptional regulator [Arthrospiribacter ruber]|uniref:XRE family transcriptional regulator n=1 Tax=Arthrospiribacter ruber TaxID=2487934 RepID=A0A951IX71_9BACT|nr:helix-turn-helix transcriptional regulator [Arthrospiribacter ruber]MBW3467491.1 XRE family transcriptional regulator [Arthrospiribacter ruber]